MSATSLTSANSYGTVRRSKDLEERKPITEPQHIQSKDLLRELIQLHQSDCLNRELEETLEGFKNLQKRSTSDSSLLAKVHAYCSSHLSTQEDRTHQEMDSLLPSTNPSIQAEPCNKLQKHPLNTVNVVTEKCSYLSESPDDSDPGSNITAGRGNIPAVTPGSCLSATSSLEHTATASGNSKSSLLLASGLSNMASDSGCKLDCSMTTADQLVWEFKRARDRLDTASNISGCSSHFELDSICSERVETMSSISDVSGYEEELFRIKKLLLLDSATPTPSAGKYEKNDKNSFPVSLRSDTVTPKENVDMQIHRLTIQLQNAVEEKEKYRIEALAMESRIGLQWQEKYQEVLRQKAHLEGRLETVQTEMTTLVAGQNEVLDHAQTLEQELKLRTAADNKAALQEIEKLVLEISRLQQVIREADNRFQDLTMQLELGDSEISQWKRDVQATEDANEKLRIELQELKIEAESKDGSIQALKNKVSEQHVEFQSLLQAKLKVENNLTNLKNEIETTRKSGYWYRDQLHACQASKAKVQQELMANEASVVSYSHQIDKMKGEIASLHQMVENTQYRAVREKEALMRKLEVIQADMVEREATIFSQIRNESTADTVSTIAAKLKGMEEEKAKSLSLADATIQELKEEVTSLKNELQTKETALEALGKENAKLMVGTTVLHETLNEKELALQLLENKCKDTEMSCLHLGENLKLKEQALLQLRNEKVAVEVALAAAEREKTEINVAIGKLRDDFAHITTSYQAMRTELREKEKHIMNLKADINILQREKQSQAEKINELGKVEEAYSELKIRISQTEVLERQVEHVSKVNRELNMKVKELSEAYSYVREQMSVMEETIAAREKQLLNQNRNFEVHSEELKAKEQSVVELQNEKTSLEEHVKKLQVKIQDLEASNKKLAGETASLQKQFSRANGAIDQFNMLCRRSEEEKNLLQKQMKSLIKDLEVARTSKSVAFNGVENVNTEHSSHEVLPTAVKSLSSYENGSVQTNLHHLYGLIQSTESKLMLLLTEIFGLQEKDFQKEQVNIVPANNIIGFDSLFSVLINIRDSVNKALEWQHKHITKVEIEKQSNEAPSNELLDLRQGSRVKVLAGEKLNNISCSTQTEEVNIESTGTQTSNAGIFNYKEQIDALHKEISKLKGSLKMTEIEHSEKHRRYESNVRTLLRKVKEHMRGRKVAERALEELHRKTKESTELVNLKCEINKLKAELEAGKKSCEEQKRIADRNQEALLILEKERGKLVQSCSISKEKLSLAPSLSEGSDTAAGNEFDQKTRELQLLHCQARISELDEEVRKSHIIIKELRKEIFSEKCETLQLKKQLASLQMGLETANDMLDTKKVDLGRTESLCCVLRTNISHLKKQLETEQQAHEECRQELEKLRENLEETRAKDPVLADQIKMLNYHLHQKSQEAASLQEKIRLSEEQWLSTEKGLQQSMSALRDELTTLRAELDSVSNDKFTLQTQTAELRAALHSSVEQNKVLRLKLETFDCENKDKLPDLTSSLPLPPVKYDEAQIAELLHLSTVLPHNKPLNNLQCCLDSLKQEMALLQRQLTAKTLPRDPVNSKVEHSVLQHV
jgi:chromosome segregation ATPase